MTRKLTARERWVLEDSANHYPCQVCGQPFMSRALLASHPHPGEKVTPKLVTRK